MNPSLLLLLIVVFMILEFLLSQSLTLLNLKNWDKPLPDAVKDLFPSEKYTKAREYAYAHTKLEIISATFFLILITEFLGFHGFAWVDQAAREASASPVVQSLIYFGFLGAASQLLSLPFSIYSTFVVEEKFGFNKTTPQLFVMDKVKSILLSAILGGGVIALLTHFYGALGSSFWIVGWIIVSSVTILLAAFYTQWLLPLFNKLTPLENGELRESIEKFASQVRFPLTNIFVMDGSKRSTKANAFFSGIGSKKNIVLFDNLIKDLNTAEVTAVLAHEVGHYQMKHVLKGVILSVLHTGFLFFIFGLLSRYSGLAEVLGSTQNSFYVSLTVFMFLYSPLSLLIRLLMKVFSRKHEYEADAFAARTNSASALISALKKLSLNHLSHLQPHPAYVFFNYSHPTLLQRMNKLTT